MDISGYIWKLWCFEMVSKRQKLSRNNALYSLAARPVHTCRAKDGNDHLNLIGMANASQTWMRSQSDI